MDLRCLLFCLVHFFIKLCKKVGPHLRLDIVNHRTGERWDRSTQAHKQCLITSQMQDAAMNHDLHTHIIMEHNTDKIASHTLGVRAGLLLLPLALLDALSLLWTVLAAAAFPPLPPLPLAAAAAACPAAGLLTTAWNSLTNLTTLAVTCRNATPCRKKMMICHAC